MQKQEWMKCKDHSRTLISHMRKERIKQNKKDLIKHWTNEGDILSKESMFLGVSFYEGGSIFGFLE